MFHAFNSQNKNQNAIFHKRKRVQFFSCFNQGLVVNKWKVGRCLGKGILNGIIEDMYKYYYGLFNSMYRYFK